jgi:excisionase family DNA binding protein
VSVEEALRIIVREELERVLATPAQRKREWLSAGELAKELGLSRPTVGRMVERGAPCVYPTGKDGHPRFNLAEVVAWLRGRDAVQGS